VLRCRPDAYGNGAGFFLPADMTGLAPKLKIKKAEKRQAVLLASESGTKAASSKAYIQFYASTIVHLSR
jgi:hypothetical protein